MSRLALLAVMPVLALGACAPTTPKDGPSRLSEASRRCVFADQIQGYTAQKDSLYVRAGSSVFKVDAAGYCPDLDHGISLGFQAQPGSGQICVGDWINIVTHDRALVGPCRARVEKSLTADEIAALPKGSRP